MFGVLFDTAWHRTIGRDSFFILPHLFMYGGALALFGASVAALALTIVAPAPGFGGLTLPLRGHRLPLGFVLAAAGMTVTMCAMPVDAWFHWRYGKDVLIWSPPHLQPILGAAVAALGLLVAVAGQSGHGILGRPGVQPVAMLAVLVTLLLQVFWVLAHYTMVPETRTPDFYPFLVALLVPLVLVAGHRALGWWAPAVVALAFVGATAAMDLFLRAIGFDRYTLTPLLLAPALAVTLLSRVRGRRGAALETAAGAGMAFVLVFVAMESWWMRTVVGRPWPWDRVVAALPRVLLAGAASGAVGWTIGGFLLAARQQLAPSAVFGGAVRARAAALGSLGLMAVGLAATYHPQRFGAPMTVAELRLLPLQALRYQEAIFWEALLEEAEPGQTLRVRSEGIIEGFPVPVGPAWCAPTAESLTGGLRRRRFTLQVNGEAVDLTPYPVVRLRDRDGGHCGWIGVGAGAQRASRNLFRYTVEPAVPPGAPPERVVEMEVVFKDP